MDLDILNRIKTILRRDLKLGPDAQIPDDMPFFGGDFDLDSLDVLLLLTSIEKEFGLKVPNEAVGQAVFQNVTTLARYILEHAPAAAPGAPVVDPLAHLPHAEPFRFVTRLLQITEGEEARGLWAVTGKEAFFAGHFPGHPLVPGVLIAEALAQLAGLVAPAGGEQVWRQGKLAQIDLRFDQAVQPPADIALHAKLARAMGPLQLFDVAATVNGQSVARGSLALKLEP